MKLVLENKPGSSRVIPINDLTHPDPTSPPLKFVAHTLANAFQITETSDCYEEERAIILNMINRRTFEVVLEFKGSGTNQTLHVILKAFLLPKFMENVKKNLKISAEIDFIPEYPGVQTKACRNVNILIPDFVAYQNGMGKFQYVTYDADLSQYILRMMTLGVLRIKIKLRIETLDVMEGPERDDKFEIIRKILHDGIATDVTIIAKNNAKIKCHKSFLIAHSSMLEGMLKSGMKESLTNVIKMETVPESVVRSLLTYLYYWELTEASSSCKMAIELLKLADYYIIPRLDKDLSDLLLKKPSEWFSVDGALDLFLLSNRLDRAPLKLTAIQALQMNFDEVKTNPRYLELFKKDPTSAMELCNAALSMKPVERDDNGGNQREDPSDPGPDPVSVHEEEEQLPYFENPVENVDNQQQQWEYVPPAANELLGPHRVPRNYYRRGPLSHYEMRPVRVYYPPN